VRQKCQATGLQEDNLQLINRMPNITHGPLTCRSVRRGAGMVQAPPSNIQGGSSGPTFRSLASHALVVPYLD
jgi:hypothetical protein